MSETEYVKLKNSLERLREQYENFLGLDKRGISGIDKEGIQESVIQRFEVCFDMLWKHVKKYLAEQGVTNLPNSPKPIFRIANKNGIIENGTLENFIDYTNTRVDTSHDYDKEKAKLAMTKVKPFIRDADEIYKILIKIK